MVSWLMCHRRGRRFPAGGEAMSRVAHISEHWNQNVCGKNRFAWVERGPSRSRGQNSCEHWLQTFGGRNTVCCCCCCGWDRVSWHVLFLCHVSGSS